MTTNTQSFLTKHATSHLMDHQIQKINRQIQDFIHVNQEIDHYHFDVCPNVVKTSPSYQGRFSQFRQANAEV